ncbi:LysR family transcriptional regulator [Pseudaminobacter arsenicus]|uniref:LysR family transcriptional regulator n=1 Tax=Borborobacter arsenicus TaxID=1851146 RepID=A0A432V4H2_9HYPH|nr:LysR family transcriptional regulator [Pseudaminobacter arsenicus]RUM97028.1 LysR family transcriptional regulator [Pseudaminobacter arsenicus]
MRKLPPLRAIQTFEAFGRHGSVAATADELGVTSGAVSQQIKRAEDMLGLRLLERHGKNISLTSWGRIYHAKVTRAFDKLREAQDELLSIRAESSLVVSCLPSLASKWVGPQLFDWQAKSGAHVRLVGTGTEPRQGEEPVDFRISYGDRVKSFEHYTELFTDWVVPACSPAFLAANPVARPADILTRSLLGIEWDSGYQQPPSWVDWAASIGETPPSTPRDLRFSISSAAIDAAINGRGFVLAQLAMVHDDLAAGRLVVPFDLRLKLSQTYFLAWQRSALEKPLGTELRAWIIKISRRQAALNKEPLPAVQ